MATLHDIEIADDHVRHMRDVGSGTSFGMGAAATTPPPFRAGHIAAIDLRGLFAVLRRRLRLFIAVVVSIAAIVVLATFLATPRYTATAVVMLDPRNERVTKVEDVLSSLPADSPVVDTEVEVLESRQLAARVVKALRLEQDPEFNSHLKTGVSLRSILQSLGLVPARPTNGSRSPKELEQVVNAVAKNLSVSRAGLTYVIRIGFKSENPAKAAIVADEFADLYILQQLESKSQATLRASNSLNSRLGQLRAQLLANETAVQQFKIDNNLLSASGATLTEQEISNYNQSLAQAEAQVAEDQARLDTAQKQLATGSTGDDVGETLNSPAIQKLKEQRAEVSRRVASMQTQFLDAYPEMTKARSELADADAQIAAETHRIVSNLEAKLQVSRRRTAAVAGSLGGARSQLASNTRASVRLDELERNAQASRTLYEAYLARFKETSTQEGLENADARLVSRARLPVAPSSPNVPLNLLVGAILALGAGAGAVGLAEALEAGIATSADVERRFRVRYVGAVPLLGSVAKRATVGPAAYVVANPLSSFSEAFRSLRASIVYTAARRPVKVVAVTSALPGEGKTTTAICLGRAAALQGFKVVIVDCDLRRRSLQRATNVEAEHGLLDVLDGTVELSRAIVKDSETDADILALTDNSATPADVFGSRAVDRLLAELRSLYDLVVLDTAPVLPVADSRVLARKADFVLLVARWRATPYQAVQEALRLLAGSSVEAGGIVLNQVNMEQQSRYGYGDPAYYFKAYRTYYLEPPEHSGGRLGSQGARA
ncbi:MAG: lipopolysaccharide biosynthesis protein [Phenylobacterium sp.]|nr:lipopolysaccharide biosynthesis protein [Phenylobacterium sp.]